MNLISVWREVASMLYWTMLAACTVGPGTVVTCARAGAEYDLSLIWALIFASILAYTLQEGTARLTIVSGKSLGQCLRVKYRHGAKLYDTAVVCWLVAVFVFFGNTLYECNNWAGGIDAILAIPGLTNTNAIRIGSCLAYATVALALLYWDKVDMLGMFLGIVMMCMVALFFVVVVVMGLDMKLLALGLVPNIPAKKSEANAEPADIILSLVGTTSLGFNLFLGGSMAKGKALESSQRGIAFSTISALEVSVLILIVGNGTFHEDASEPFSIKMLADLIRSLIGEVGVFIFAVGFIAAALSSMLAVPLGAALTADSLFSRCEEEDNCEVKKKSKVKKETIVSISIEQEEAEPSSLTPLKESIEPGEGTSFPPQEAACKLLTSSSHSPPLSPTKSLSASMTSHHKELELECAEEGKVLKTLPRVVYWGIISVMVAIATIVISLDAPRVEIILIAQVFNGCLLPFFAICLLTCLNDPQFMASSPQKGWANIFLLISVTITIFLASNVIIQKLFGHLVDGISIKFGIAGGISLVTITLLCCLTSLGKDLINSWKKQENPSA
jgi:Mn2+/Fe2+ NRAMP family transporter